MIAAGFGCRKGCSSDDMMRALDAALHAAGCARADVRALYAPAFKAAEPGLADVATRLSKPLVFLRDEDLKLQAAFAISRSEHAQARLGVPSVAETAALAGARAANALPERAARLLGPRQISGGATCALAIADDAARGGGA